MSQNSLQTIEEKISLIRSQKVMLDSHLAELYGVPTHRLNEQVKRNLKRFPPDLMFKLSKAETIFLTSQIAISKKISGKDGRGGRRTRPLVFTQEGVAMLSSVLNSDRAIKINIQIMRAFVNIREWLVTHHDLQEKIKKLSGNVKKSSRWCFRQFNCC